MRSNFELDRLIDAIMLLIIICIFIFLLLVTFDSTVSILVLDSLCYAHLYITLSLISLVVILLSFEKIIKFEIPEVNLIYTLKSSEIESRFKGEILENDKNHTSSLKYYGEKNTENIISGKVNVNKSTNSIWGIFEDKTKIFRFTGTIIDKDLGEIVGILTGEEFNDEGTSCNLFNANVKGYINSELPTRENTIKFIGSKMPAKIILDIPDKIKYLTIDPPLDKERKGLKCTLNLDKQINEIKINIIWETITATTPSISFKYNNKSIDKKPEPEPDQSLIQYILKIISKNAFLIVSRFLMLLLISFLLIYLTPPSYIIIDPPSISESLAVNDPLIKTISINNIGANLSSLKIEPDMSESSIPIYISHNNNSSSFLIQNIKINNRSFKNTNSIPIDLANNKPRITISISDETRLNEEIKLNYSMNTSDEGYIIKIESINIYNIWLDITDNKNITIKRASNSAKSDESSSPEASNPDGEEVGNMDVARLILIPEAVPSDLSRDRVGLFKVKIDAKYLTPGEYLGFIDIKANKSTILGESEQDTVGRIPVVLNVTEAEGSQTVGTTQEEININISGTINLNKI
ncbi:MAG TPA: hypothetical protein P5049_00955 [Methanothrix sp.]|nr:hypothetical protein [Methanothrix sp.]